MANKSNSDKFVSMALSVTEKLPSGVGAKFIYTSNLKDSEASQVIFEEFLPRALVNGKYIAAPDPQIAEKGLEYIQVDFEVRKEGVSAKIVVTLYNCLFKVASL